MIAGLGGWTHRTVIATNCARTQSTTGLSGGSCLIISDHAGAISVYEPRLLPTGGAETVTAILGQRHADVVKAVNTGDLKSPGRRPLRVRFPPSA